MCNTALLSFRLFRKNLGNLRDFFGQMVYRPPLAKNFPYAYGQVTKKFLLLTCPSVSKGQNKIMVFR